MHIMYATCLEPTISIDFVRDGLFEWGCSVCNNDSSDHDRKSQETTNSNVNDKSKDLDN